MDSEETLLEPHERFLLFVESIRNSLIRIIGLVLVCSIVGYNLADDIVRYLQGQSGVDLAAFGVAETFFTFLYLAVAFGFFVSFPYIVYRILAALRAIYPAFSRWMIFFFCIATVILFYAGAFFCIEVALKYGTKFLLSFGTENLKPIISVKKFMSFTLVFVFGFGFIFELPLVMMLLGRLGILKAEVLGRYRRYAFLAIILISAILTPTPDIFNLLLMAVPLYLLFEIGLLGMHLVRRNVAE